MHKDRSIRSATRSTVYNGVWAQLILLCLPLFFLFPGSQFVRDLDVLSTSYNVGTRAVMLQLTPPRSVAGRPGQEGQEGRASLTLAAGPLCTGPVSCHNPVPLLLWDVHSSRGEAGPFAWYKQDVFFVIRMSEETMYNVTLELRRFVDCAEKFPVRTAAVDLVHCSSFIATLEEFEGSQGLKGQPGQVDVIPGRHLHVVPTAFGVHVFVVMFHVVTTNGTVPEAGRHSVSSARLLEVAVPGAEGHQPKVGFPGQGLFTCYCSDNLLWVF